jgi:cell division protein FtsZ
MTEQAAITVIGVGGGGGNAVSAMIRQGFDGVGFAVANTDAQALANSPADVQIQLGPRTTRGRGAGGDPAVGHHSAQASSHELTQAVAGSDMVFVTAGLGGGTGTGAAPMVAATAREHGALTVGVVTTPFPFEGKRRARHAQAGIEALEQHVDALLVIPNESLLDLGDGDLSMLDAFAQADAVLCDAVRGISDLITQPGLVNLDFADVAAVLRSGGRAMMGTGRGQGPSRAAAAAEQAMTSPLLNEGSIQGAGALLLNFRAGPDLKLREVHDAAAAIESCAREDVDVLFGVVHDPEMEGALELTLVATGLGGHAEQQTAPQANAQAQPGQAGGRAGRPAAQGMGQQTARGAGQRPVPHGSGQGPPPRGAAAGQVPAPGQVPVQQQVPAQKSHPGNHGPARPPRNALRYL